MRWGICATAVIVAGAVVAGCTSSPTLDPRSGSQSITAAPLTASPTPGIAASLPVEARGPYPVTKVVDGDTIWVRIGGDRVKVRLIGIDTPETVDPSRPPGCFGAEASERAHQLLDGARVYLELDPSQGEFDRYGRTLAFAWLPNGDLVNLLLVRDGFAREYTYDQPYRYQSQFRAAEAQARQARRGLWSPAACP